MMVMDFKDKGYTQVPAQTLCMHTLCAPAKFMLFVQKDIAAFMSNESATKTWKPSSISMIVQAMDLGGAVTVWGDVAYDCSRGDSPPVCPIRWFATPIAKKLNTCGQLKPFHAHIIRACRAADAKPVGNGKPPKVMVQLASGKAVELTPAVREYLACTFYLRAAVKATVICKASGGLSKKIKNELDFADDENKTRESEYIAKVHATAEAIASGAEDVVLHDAFGLEDHFFKGNPLPKVLEFFQMFNSQCGNVLSLQSKTKVWAVLVNIGLIQLWFGSFARNPEDNNSGETEEGDQDTEADNSATHAAPGTEGTEEKKAEPVLPTTQEAQLALLGAVDGHLIHEDSSLPNIWTAPQEYWTSANSLAFMHSFYSLMYYTAEVLVLEGKIEPTHQAVRLFTTDALVRDEIRAAVMLRQTSLVPLLNAYLVSGRKKDVKPDYDFKTSPEAMMARGVCVVVSACRSKDTHNIQILNLYNA